jgi:hypothetical protein
MSKLIDLLYGGKRDSAKGKLHLLNHTGSPVTVTKEIRYTVADGASHVHINGYEDLSQYCRRAGYTYRSGKNLKN